MVFRWTEVPLIGDTVYNAGQIIKIGTNPCDIDVWIAVKAAFYYTPVAIYTLFKPTPEDYWTDRVTNVHKKRRRRRIKNFNTAFAFGEPPTPGKVVLFRLAQIVERVGWYIMIADVSAKYGLNWISLTYELSGCQTDRSVGAQIKGPSQTSFVSFGLGSQLLTGSSVHAYGGALANPTIISLPRNVTAQYMGNISWVPYQGGIYPPGRVQYIDVQRRLNGGPYQTVERVGVYQGSPAPGSAGFSGVSWDLGSQQADWTLRAYIDQGGVAFQNNDWSCGGPYEVGMNPDP